MPGKEAGCSNVLQWLSEVETMAETKRIMARVDLETVAEIQRLADGMNMSREKLLGILITIAVRSSGATFDTFGATLTGLMGADAEHDSK
jgi:hypothetical protein